MTPIQTHIRILGILHIVFGAVKLFIGLALFLFFGGIAGLAGIAGGEEGWIAGPILGAVGGLILVIMLVLSIPGIVVGIGLLNYRPWARILGIVLSIFELVQVPFGTILGFYGIWALLSPEGTSLFKDPATR